MSKNKQPPVTRLYEAACEIVSGTRLAIMESGKPADELRIPIHCQGTDLLITIEAGASIRARNSLHIEHSKATGEPLPDERGAIIRDAMAIIAIQADNLKICHSRNGNWDACETNAHNDFEHMMDVLKRLENLRTSEWAKN